MTSITSFKVVLVFFVSMCSSLEALDFGSLKKVIVTRLFDVDNDDLQIGSF